MSTEQPSTVDAVLRRSASRTPDRAALRFDKRTWTYADLDTSVSRVAGWLLAQGLSPGDRVAAFGHNSDAYLLGYLGCARAGLVHVPINYNLNAADLAYLLRQSGSTGLLLDAALASTADAALAQLDADDRPSVRLPLRDEIGSVLDATVDQSWAAAALPVVRDDDLAQLLYTSGTTSLPKGAMMTHRALVHEYMSCVAALDLGPDDRPVNVFPLYHSAQMHVFLMPWLMVGARNVLLEAFDPVAVLDEIEAGGDCFFAPPTAWIGLANHAEFGTRDLSSLRKGYYGASIMPVPVLQRLQEELPDLGFYNCFGQSEIGPLAMVLRPEEHAERPASCGRPVLFVEARCVDDEGVDVAPGERGEVVYRSPQLCTGYWADEAATGEAFRDGWFRSGDMAVRDGQGYYTVVDRLKDVINTGGVLVASREVEDALYGHPAVAEVAVIGVPDERWIEAVVAVVVLSDSSVTGDDVLEYGRERLARFKAPKQVHVVDELPKNASGKLLKRVLRDEFGPTQDA
jgi:fatty-acyl-CoA synthase